MKHLFSVRLGGKEIRALRGDLTKWEGDAIVNPANSLMIMGGGVAGAIKRVGGSQIEEEAKKYAPVPVGEAIATSGGKLKAKWVIHAPTMERPAMRIPPDNVRLAVRAALRKAEELGVESLAIPGMGTGVGGVDPRVAASIIVEEVAKFLERSVRLKRVDLLDLDEKVAKEFEKALRGVPST